MHSSLGCLRKQVLAGTRLTSNLQHACFAMSPKKQSSAVQQQTSSNGFAALATAEAAEVDAVSTISSKAATSSSSSKADGGSRTPPKGTFQDPLVWVDLEMTGLDIEKDTIIEIAVIVTDGDLKDVEEGPALAIHVSDEVLDGMNDWCKEHHGKSGLTKRVRESKVSMQEAQQQVLDFIRRYVPQQGMAQLAGNSVHVDRMFLNKHMPEVVSYLSYRIVDVSSIKELARRWYPKDYKNAPRKVLAHTALSDIRESIEELKYYRRAIFKQTGGGKK